MKQILFTLLFINILNCGSPLFDKKEDNTASNLALGALVLNSQRRTTSTAQSVTTINFSVRANSTATTDVSCSGTIPATVAGTTNSTLKDARFYVHDVNLLSADGSKTPFNITTDNQWQIAAGSNSFGSYPGVALLDFEDGTSNCAGGTTETNKSIRGTSVAGNYTGVEFKVGVPFYLNHLQSATASAPLNITAMYWAWNSGYKFAKIEFTASSANLFHLGSGTCTGNGAGPVNECGLPNRPTVSVSKTSGNFDASTDRIVLDINALYSGADASGTAINTCMAGNATAACQPIIRNIGVNPADGRTLTTQSAFSIK
jgi:uncharacterized repeat protein (TIGR04052 family)